MLEDFKRCSESHLWQLMMSFYDRKGPESWSQGIVPHFITCNAFIGRSYAKACTHARATRAGVRPLAAARLRTWERACCMKLMPRVEESTPRSHTSVALFCSSCAMWIAGAHRLHP